MPRKPFVCSSIDPYSITARSHNKDFFPLPTSEVWEIMTDYLYLTQVGFNLRIHSFVLMSNHFHLLASFPDANLSRAMQFFMGRSSRHISKTAGQINQIYGNRCYRSQITSYHHFKNVYKYNYRNPVEAGLCDKVEDYEFSTFAGVVGKHHLAIPLVEDSILFSNDSVSQTLEWLNTIPKKRHQIFMQNALRRKVFQFPKYLHQPNELNHILY